MIAIFLLVLGILIIIETGNDVLYFSSSELSSNDGTMLTLNLSLVSFINSLKMNHIVRKPVS